MVDKEVVGKPRLQRPQVRRRQGPHSGSLCWGPLAHDPLQGPQEAMCDMNCEEARTQPWPLVHVFQAWSPSIDPSSLSNFFLWSRPRWAHPVQGGLPGQPSMRAEASTFLHCQVLPQGFLPLPTPYPPSPSSGPFCFLLLFLM